MDVKKSKESEAQLMQFFNKRKNVLNEKLRRCREFKYSNPPESYRQNSPKEQLVLEHVIQLKKQFQQYSFQNRQLFLYPKNQCDVYKFICTTIRPTKLGFLELYNYEECAKRLSNFIYYQELDPPDQFPKCIPSPANVAKWQKGDCFDMSILLTSLLIGVGYDAYCIYGIAPKQITTKNQALLECPFLDTLRETKQQKINKEETKMDDTLFPKRQTQSIFDKTTLENQRKQKQQLAKKALTIDDDEPDQLAPDLYLGKRLHCWVLLKKGKRDVQQDLFIQPSTGRIYDIKKSPYLLVDSIFNNTNFFIHMHPKHKVDQIKFDLYQTITWQYVMLNEESFRNIGEEEGHEIQDNNGNLNKNSDEEDKLKYLAQTLDMPPPWSPKIFIEKDKFLMGTPLGETTTFFIKVKVDKYAEYSQPDGLVLKYTLFDDYKKIKINEIGYFYKNRSDKLERKYRYPYQFKTVEHYGPGKMPHWRDITEVDRRVRIINYYPNRNHDGLMKRVEKIGQKTIEYYQNRDDHIILRSVTFQKDDSEQGKIGNTPKKYFYDDNHVGKVCILKISQRFAKKKNIPASEQIAKMSVDFIKEKVYVFYHMNEGEIQPIKKQYNRDSILGIGKIDNSQKNNTDPIIQQQHKTLHDMEKAFYQDIRSEQTYALEQYRQMRNMVNLTIQKTLYEKAREKFKQNKNKVEQDLPEQDANDYLRPYLQKLNLPLNQPLSAQNASLVKTEVIKKLKERVLARANIIRQRLQKQQDNLKQLQEQYQKKQQKQSEKQLSEVKFKISILQSRSSRFEAMALQKFQDMDQRLNSDFRLAALRQDKKDQRK